MKVLTRLLIALLIGVPAWAGQIRGRVLNAQGSALAGASISVASPQGENLAHAATAEDGTYAIPGLPPGSYILTVAAPSVGSTLSRQVVIPESGEAVQADFQFQPAAAASGIAAEERNPNIFVYRIDLNDLRNRLTVARGPDPTYVAEFAPDKNYFGAEYGAPLLSYEILRPRSLANSWRGSLLALHQNSAVSARNFFNVGPLQASRATTYSITANGPLFFEKDSLLLQFGQSLSSGAVNGNIQSPLDSERVPITTDPQKRAVIESLLRAYPLESPNLGERRLNSNASRNIDSVDALGRYDYRWSESRSLAFRYTINDYSEEPFQLVAGQNPQTDVRTQAAYLSLTQSFSPAANGRLAFNFDRTAARLLPTKRFTDLFASLLLPDVPDLDFSADQFTDVGPGAQFPRKRFQNRFQLYADVSRRAGRHTLSAGWSTTRVQVNDLQSDNARGTFRFAGDFGRTEIQNFLLGTPSSFTIAIGNFYRGFRNWEHFGYLQDQLQLSPSFSLSAG
ncbi:MAG TPA: carboxypeptidase-like regulatory domain-containing protein, partial [Terriglobia bacterium]|nr:carboxypeptidase-like regulatory domain-containing protein [Terriglobia bacterium]